MVEFFVHFHIYRNGLFNSNKFILILSIHMGTVHLKESKKKNHSCLELIQDNYE